MLCQVDNLPAGVEILVGRPDGALRDRRAEKLAERLAYVLDELWRRWEPDVTGREPTEAQRRVLTPLEFAWSYFDPSYLDPVVDL